MDIKLNKHSPFSLSDQLQAHIRLLIIAGTLEPGELLPTVHTLAAATDTNYNTVAAAYRALEAQGYLVQRRRAGTRVAAEPPVSAQERLSAQVGAEVAERIHAFDLEAEDTLQLIGAHIAREESTQSAPHVGVLAGDAVQAASFARKAAALFGDKVNVVPVTLASYERQTYAATLVAPALLESLISANTVRDSTNLPYTPFWPSSYDFPAGAD